MKYLPAESLTADTTPSARVLLLQLFSHIRGQCLFFVSLITIATLFIKCLTGSSLTGTEHFIGHVLFEDLILHHFCVHHLVLLITLFKTLSGTLSLLTLVLA
uniref:ORF4 n=1 Tax=Echinococcus granulosus TaxID=6210 RepID=A0A068WWM1_ECHGR|nr:hypothetical protein EgrG_000683300 [Echinococcus granulosus]